MSFTRAMPTTRGGMSLRHLSPQERLRITSLFHLKEKMEDFVPSSPGRDLIIAKLNQCIDNRLPRSVQEKTVKIAKRMAGFL